MQVGGRRAGMRRVALDFDRVFGFRLAELQVAEMQSVDVAADGVGPDDCCRIELLRSPECACPERCQRLLKGIRGFLGARSTHLQVTNKAVGE